MKTKTRIWILPMASAVLFAVGIVLLVVMSAGTSASIRAVGSTAYPAMDLTTRFAPDVAIRTKLSPDHLDRHGGMEGYVAAKQRLFQAQQPDDVVVVGVDDRWSASVSAALLEAGMLSIEARTISESLESLRVYAIPTADAAVPSKAQAALAMTAGWIETTDGWLTVDGKSVADLSEARSLPGRHNWQNAAFAYAASTALGVSHEQAVAGLMSFPGLAHRMETVARTERVRFVNDSKATNADAARQALSSYERVFWIAGGRAKDGGIDSLGDLFPRVECAFLIGEAAEDFAARLTDVPHVICGDMDKAVERAAHAAAATGRDEVVLLSPACASFDQYPDFEARGEAFRAAVRRVIDEGGTP